MPKDTKTLCIKKGCASVLTQPLIFTTKESEKKVRRNSFRVPPLIYNISL